MKLAIIIILIVSCMITTKRSFAKGND